MDWIDFCICGECDECLDAEITADIIANPNTVAVLMNGDGSILEIWEREGG